MYEDEKADRKWMAEVYDRMHFDHSNTISDGDRYYYGDGAKQDYAMAARLYEMAARAGDTYSQRMLGVCYWRGVGVRFDLGSAYDWFCKAAESYDAYANYYLGEMYESGILKPDYESRAMGYYSKASSAVSEAQFRTAVHTLLGRGGYKDPQKATSMLKNLAARRFEAADDVLNNMTMNADDRKRLRELTDRADACISESATKAVELYRKAAEKGNDYAQYRLGECYFDGDGVKADEREGFRWCLRAAWQGFAEAQYNVGVYYYNGLGVEKSFGDAEVWLRRAIKQGHDGAKSVLRKLHQ